MQPLVPPVAARAASALALACATFCATAQDAAADNARVAAMQQELAELKAQTELLAAQFPVIEGGKAGTVTQGSGAMYPLGAWAQVWKRLGAAAQEVCTAVAPHLEGVTPTLVAPAELPAALRYHVVAAQLAQLEAQFDALLAPPVTPGAAVLPAVAAVVPSLVSITKLFRTDRTLHDETVTLSNDVLNDLVQACLAGQGRAVHHAGPAATMALVQGRSALLARLSSLTARSGMLSAKADDASRPEEAAQAKALLERYTTFHAELLAVPPGAAEPPLADVLRGEVVAAPPAPPHPPALLVVHIVKQGGSSMVTSNLWREDRLYVGGGAIVGWRLIVGGALKHAGLVAKVGPGFERVPLDTRPH
jgi:hypothetical protein